MIHCKHCGSSDKWVQCRWYWWLPYAAERKRSGADLPCMCDKYADEDRDMRNLPEHRRRNNRIVAIVLLVFVLAGWALLLVLR